MKSNKETLIEELVMIATHEHLEAILRHDWVLDSTLPIPSVDLIMFLSEEMIAAESFLEFAGRNNRDEAVAYMAGKLREKTRDEHCEAVERRWPFMESSRWSMNTEWQRGGRSSTHPHAWDSAYWLFRWPHPDDSNEVKVGARGAGSQALAALLYLAVLQRDFASIRSLADLLERQSKGEGAPIASLPKWASRVEGSKTRLQAEWEAAGKEGCVRKSAVAGFLEEYHGEGAGGDLWNDVWKVLNWPSDGDRKGPRSKEWGIALAKKIKAE